MICEKDNALGSETASTCASRVGIEIRVGTTQWTFIRSED